MLFRVPMLDSAFMALSTVVPRKRPSPVAGLLAESGRGLLRGQLGRGPAVEAFEDTLSRRLGDSEVLAVGSGRFALLLVLEALGVRPPATIYMAAYNASCVPNVLQAAGYRLHFVDVDPETLHLDPQRLPDAPAPGGALIATHIEGSPMPLPPLREWTAAAGLRLVEDAAHALGARLDGEPVGALADGAIFSLGRGKHLNTLGGGLAVVSDPDPAARAALRRLGETLAPAPNAELLRAVVMEGLIETGTVPQLFGTFALPVLRLARRFGADPMSNLFEDDKSAMAAVPPELRRRLSNLQARFGLAGLAAFDRGLQRRRAHAERLRHALVDAVELQRPVAGAEPAWLELTALVDDRAGFQRALLDRGVDTQRTWMDACDALPAFAGAAGGPCEVARAVAARALYLPTYAALTDAQVERVIEGVRACAPSAPPAHPEAAA